ncbi:uncharacterized protein LOC124256828 [Haliotis rubra]|uniref:uncharacterized protein LOC124256828 n=1 Tax=Haliotis rubra TaxID=36100 RepID=UPI001EE622F4|nr:uncharacterized protein LOC124256828 [Haliotis rubra]
MRIMPAVRDRGLIFITAVACLFICILFHAQGVPELICPGIIEIGTSAVLICSSSTANAALQFTDPNGTLIQCDTKMSFCPKIQGYNASVLNETQTQLQVNKVKPSHGGNWTCKELGQPNDNKDGCSITVRRGKGFLVPVVLGSVGFLIISSSILICIVKRNRKSLRPSLEHHNTADDVSEGDSIELSEDPSVSLRDEALNGALRDVGEDDGVYSLAK